MVSSYKMHAFLYTFHSLPVNRLNRILKSIGKGHFGAVSLGVWQIPGGQEEVAIKTAKAESEAERLKLLQEAAIMGQFVHHNVVRLHGVVTVGEPVSGGIGTTAIHCML